MIKNEIKEKDETVLKHLKRISCEFNELDFILKFIFESNDYFYNDSLTKTFTLTDIDMPIKADGHNINWKDGKNITKKTVKKK